MEHKMGVKIGSVSEFTEKSALRAAMAEFVSVLLFTFISCGSAVVSGFSINPSLDVDVNSKVLSIALTNGFTICVLVGTTARLSGGHINPSVTFAMMLCGRITVVRSFMYWVAQIAGGIFGAGLIAAIIPDKVQGNLGGVHFNTEINAMDGTMVVRDAAQMQVGAAFVTEAIVTFTLLFVIWGTAVDPCGPSASAPLLIGLTVVATNIMAIPITGAALNPARAIGPAVWSQQWQNHWIYWFGPFLGASIGALFYECIFMFPIPSTAPAPVNDKHLESVKISQRPGNVPDKIRTVAL